jgi:hypothetical protein
VHRKNAKRKGNKTSGCWHLDKQGGKTTEGLRILDSHGFADTGERIEGSYGIKYVKFVKQL